MEKFKCLTKHFSSTQKGTIKNSDTRLPRRATIASKYSRQMPAVPSVKNTSIVATWEDKNTYTITTLLVVVQHSTHTEERQLIFSFLCSKVLFIYSVE